MPSFQYERAAFFILSFRMDETAFCTNLRESKNP